MGVDIVELGSYGWSKGVFVSVSVEDCRVFPKWRIKVLPTAGEKMLETCKLWSKNHQQYPAKDCLVFLRNHDSWQEMNWSLSDCLVVEAAIRTQGVHLFACPDC